ncbi:SIMPL domain-containing protein [Shewanella gelidii]|uniref:DUF541 domain-containing protein n=1 Tax=Shewanella gelidii TaxID=1642821 RepID=A0A917JX64_9GAMM|nr:SIMPL domain-containing protein [Shewanella gelidii]MCL1098647.1 SIMPL domain-containing protein [Shewanella gelidii]GGI86367.1 hypothetical protein GCM10009332_24630 [Shewanella gelidii]
MNLKPIGLTLFLALPVLADTELKGSPDELRRFLHPEVKTISMTQDAEIVAFKDQAVISLLVTTEDDKLAVSLQKNSKIRASISSALEAQNIPLSRIKNSKFSTSPDYGWFGKNPDSYKVTNTVTVRINNESGMQSIAKIVDSYDEVSLVDTQYEHSEKEAFTQKVKEKALNKVLAQKAFYSKTLGINLKAVSFSDHATAVNEEIERIQVTGSRMDKSYSSSKHSHEPMHASFEKVTYSANVTVTFIAE